MAANLGDFCALKNGLYHLEDPTPQVLPDTPQSFIEALPGPTVITITGAQRGTQIIATLLDGDRPGGLLALYALIRDNISPAFDTKLILGAVDAAKRAPLFTHATLPGQRSLPQCLINMAHHSNADVTNICEADPLALSVAQEIHQHSHAVVLNIFDADIHKPLCFASSAADNVLSLAAYFSDTVFINAVGSNLVTFKNTQVLNVAIPNMADLQTNAMLKQGLQELLTSPEPFTLRPPKQVIDSPCGLELRRSANVTFSDKPVFGVNVTLNAAMFDKPFCRIEPGNCLGWVDHNKLDHLRLTCAGATAKITDCFNADDNCVTVTQPLNLYIMATTATGVKRDGLLYFVPCD